MLALGLCKASPHGRHRFAVGAFSSWLQVPHAHRQRELLSYVANEQNCRRFASYKQSSTSLKHAQRRRKKSSFSMDDYDDPQYGQLSGATSYDAQHDHDVTIQREGGHRVAPDVLVVRPTHNRSPKKTLKKDEEYDEPRVGSTFKKGEPYSLMEAARAAKAAEVARSAQVDDIQMPAVEQDTVSSPWFHTSTLKQTEDATAHATDNPPDSTPDPLAAMAARYRDIEHNEPNTKHSLDNADHTENTQNSSELVQQQHDDDQHNPYPQSPNIITETPPLPQPNAFPADSSPAFGTRTSLEDLQQQLTEIESALFSLNKGKAFNVGSPRQVSDVLFGKDDSTQSMSTSRDVLEGMAVGSTNKAKTARLVLQWRQLKSRLKKMQNYQKNQQINSTSNNQKNNQSTPSPQTTNYPSPPNTQSTQDPLILVDASAFIFRAYHAMPPLHRNDGEPVGAVLGFCNMLNRLVLGKLIASSNIYQNDHQIAPEFRPPPPRVVLVFDPPSGSSFRNEIYPEYKAHRPPCPIDLLPQFDFARQAAVAFGIPSLEAVGYEADDVIATLTTMAVEAGVSVEIVTGDKDLMQLVSEHDHEDDGQGEDEEEDGGGSEVSLTRPTVHMIDPMKYGRAARVTYKDVCERWGVPPSKLGDVLALAGDSADNVPGVPGIGPKIGAALINQFETLDHLLDNLDEIKQQGRREKLKTHADQAKLSRQLVELDRQVPLEAINSNITFFGGEEGGPASVSLLETPVQDLRMEPLNETKLIEFISDMGLRNLKERTMDRLNTARNSPRTTFWNGSGGKSLNRHFSAAADSVSSQEGSDVSKKDGEGNKEVKISQPKRTTSKPRRRKKYKLPPLPEDYVDVPF